MSNSVVVKTEEELFAAMKSETEVILAKGRLAEDIKNGVFDEKKQKWNQIKSTILQGVISGAIDALTPTSSVGSSVIGSFAKEQGKDMGKKVATTAALASAGVAAVSAGTYFTVVLSAMMKDYEVDSSWSAKDGIRIKLKPSNSKAK